MRACCNARRVRCLVRSLGRRYETDPPGDPVNHLVTGQQIDMSPINNALRGNPARDRFAFHVQRLNPHWRAFAGESHHQLQLPARAFDIAPQS